MAKGDRIRFELTNLTVEKNIDHEFAASIAKGNELAATLNISLDIALPAEQISIIVQTIYAVNERKFIEYAVRNEYRILDLAKIVTTKNEKEHEINDPSFLNYLVEHSISHARSAFFLETRSMIPIPQIPFVRAKDIIQKKNEVPE